MGTQRVQMKGGLPWLVRLALRAGTKDFCPALAVLVGPVQNIFFSHRTLFQFICPHRSVSWTGSRAGSPVY
jgi:hypothetical protein